jgi:hypothetical protein
LNSYLGPYTSCSTHFAAKDVGVAHSQSNEAQVVLLGYSAATPRFFGMDANLAYPDSYIASWISNSYAEVDPFFRSTWATPAPTKKIDYSLGRGYGSNRLTPNPYCDSYYSDHCYLLGYFVI